MIKSLYCLGFRGFSQKHVLNLAVPNGTPGSGLTVLVGPNGGGKSTLVECFNKISLAQRGASFSKGKRNLLAGDIVEIGIECDEGWFCVNLGGDSSPISYHYRVVLLSGHLHLLC